MKCDRCGEETSPDKPNDWKLCRECCFQLGRVIGREEVLKEKKKIIETGDQVP